MTVQEHSSTLTRVVASGTPPNGAALLFLFVHFRFIILSPFYYPFAALQVRICPRAMFSFNHAHQTLLQAKNLFILTLFFFLSLLDACQIISEIILVSLISDEPGRN